jgi:Recombination endonuclease VII
MSDMDFANMLEFQAGLCAICCEPMKPGMGTCVDHDHLTGKVRGLTCRHCNFGLGHFQDDPVKLESAAVYLTAVA